jgi:Amt family ammonium transporter
VIKATVGLRVSAEKEIAGLDLGEHGTAAYPDLLPGILPRSAPAAATAISSPSATQSSCERTRLLV